MLDLYSRIAPPLTYDDCLQLWLRIGAVIYARVHKTVCEGYQYGYTPDNDRSRWSSSWLRTDVVAGSANRPSYVLVRPSDAAGRDGSGPLAFDVACGDSANWCWHVCEIHRRNDSLGIGEHYVLSGSAHDVARYGWALLPASSAARQSMAAHTLTALLPGSAVAPNMENEAPLLYLHNGDDPDPDAYAAPVRGTMIQGETSPHEGTIILPNGIPFTEVYRATHDLQLELQGRCALGYRVDLEQPFSALSHRLSSPSRSYAKPVAGALALAAIAAAVSRK